MRGLGVVTEVDINGAAYEVQEAKMNKLEDIEGPKKI